MAKAQGAGSTPPKAPGGLAGNGGVQPNKPRAGKTISVGGVRTVKYFRLTAHELDYVSEPQKEASVAFSIAAFAGGVLVSILTGFSFSPPASELIRGIWGTLGVVSFVATCWYVARGYNRRGLAVTRLQLVKDEHDFE